MVRGGGARWRNWLNKATITTRCSSSRRSNKLSNVLVTRTAPRTIVLIIMPHSQNMLRQSQRILVIILSLISLSSNQNYRVPRRMRPCKHLFPLLMNHDLVIAITMFVFMLTFMLLSWISIIIITTTAVLPFCYINAYLPAGGHHHHTLVSFLRFVWRG